MINQLISPFCQSVNCIKDYFTNSSDSLSNVGAKVEKVKKIAQKGLEVCKTVGDEIHALNKKKKATEDEFKDATIDALLEAPSEEAYFQVLTKKIAFHGIMEGDVIQPSLRAKTETYTVKKIIDDACGLRALFLVPIEKDTSSPLLIFRGTDENNIHNILDDINKDVGELNFERNREKLHAAIESIALEYGQFHVLGFSFGGALARKTLAEFSEYVKRCTVYDGLRPGEKTIKLFQDKLQQYPSGMEKPEVWEYRHAKDLISLLGGPEFPATPNRQYTFGSQNDAITHIEAHSLLGLSDQNVPISTNSPVPDNYKNVIDVTEKIRQVTSSFITPIHKKIVSKYVN